jgi:hypothetical protein
MNKSPCVALGIRKDSLPKLKGRREPLPEELIVYGFILLPAPNPNTNLRARAPCPPREKMTVCVFDPHGGSGIWRASDPLHGSGENPRVSTLERFLPP